MEIGIKLTVKMDEKTKYNMGLEIPTSISASDPFDFRVIQETTSGKEGRETVQEDIVMQVTFGGSDAIYAKVEPPKSIIELAGVGEYIDSFQASVKEGEYDPEKNQFTEGTDVTDGKNGTDEEAGNAD